MTAKIKLNSASGGGSVSLQAPSSSSNNRVFTLPDIADATMATVNGIQEFDQWYLTGNKSDNSDITANLSRSSITAAAGQIGTGMTESSGIFSFPRTGKYLVIVTALFQLKDFDNANVATQVTINNSSYNRFTLASDGNNGTGSRGGSGSSFAFIDVTDVSQVKVKFTTESLGTDSYIQGNSSELFTNFIFVRIGDT